MRLPKWLYRSLHNLLAGLEEKFSRANKDHLLNAVDSAHANIVYAFTDPELELETGVLREINDHFLAVRDNISDDGGNETYPFFIRAYSAWRVAVRLWASGALPETFTVLRNALENTAQGCRLRLADTNLFERWINRHAAQNAHRNEFTFRRALPSLDPNFSRVLETLHDLCIDRGAHPNPRGTLTGVGSSDEGDLIVAYQGGTFAEMLEIADYLSLGGIAILQTFKRCYPEAFQEVGIEASLAALTLDVFTIYETRENLREQERAANGTEETELGWVRILRQDGIWGTTEPAEEVTTAAP